MVNFGLNSASILGIFLAVAGAGLYALRSVRPELSRDHDIFFAAVGLLCGLILLFQGWRLDPILQFGQFLLTGSAIFFAVETVRLRGVATEQARRSSPIVEDRPVSDAYTYNYQEAELEALEPYDDERYATRQRLKGSDYRGSNRGGYESEEPRTPKSRRPPSSASDPYSGQRTSRVRRPRPSSSPTYEPYDEWSEPSQTREKRPTSSRSPRRPSDVEPPETPPRTPRKRPSRPPTDDVYSIKDPEATSTEYVDYQPIDETKEDNYNSEWDKESQPERNPRRDYNDVESQGDRNPRQDYNDVESQGNRNPRRDYNEDSPSRFDY